MIRLSVAATALSVAIMILTLAFVSGFQQAIADKVFSFWGHIRLQQHPSYSSDLSDEIPSFSNDTVVTAAKNNPAVRQIDLYANKAALLESAANMEGVMLKGVDQQFSSARILPFMQKGEWLSFDTLNPSIVVSSYTARMLSLDTGQKAFLYFMNQEGGAPRVRLVRVSGIYKTAIEEYDRSFAFVDIGLIKKMQGWLQQEISGYEITLKDYQTDKTTVNELMDAIPMSWYATSIRDIYPNIFDWLELQNVNRTLIVTIMCIVAVINLISCLLILVLERRKMIGLLKAIGASNAQVQGIFWRQGVYICLKGLLWGNIIGLSFCYLQKKFGLIQLDEAAYYISVAPVKLIWWEVLAVNVGTFVICFLILLLPSLLVRKMDPVSALRFD